MPTSHEHSFQRPFTLKLVSDLPIDRASAPSLVSTRSRMAARLTLAIVIGLAAGAATEWSVPHLPFSLEPLGNTAAPWVLVAVAVALTARRMDESLMLAVVTLPLSWASTWPRPTAGGRCPGTRSSSGLPRAWR
jgi:hypothetical protein